MVYKSWNCIESIQQFKFKFFLETWRMVWTIRRIFWMYMVVQYFLYKHQRQVRVITSVTPHDKARIWLCVVGEYTVCDIITTYVIKYVTCNSVWSLRSLFCNGTSRVTFWIRWLNIVYSDLSSFSKIIYKVPSYIQFAYWSSCLNFGIELGVWIRYMVVNVYVYWCTGIYVWFLD